MAGGAGRRKTHVVRVGQVGQVAPCLDGRDVLVALVVQLVDAAAEPWMLFRACEREGGRARATGQLLAHSLSHCPACTWPDSVCIERDAPV